MTELPITEIGPIQIEDGVRYVVKAFLDRPVSCDVVSDIQQRVGRKLNDWWESGDKFCIVVIENGADLRFEHIDGGTECKSES